MAIKFTSKEFKESIRRGVAGGSYIKEARVLREMKNKGIKSFSGSGSKQKAFSALERAKKLGTISSSQRDRTKSFLRRSSEEAQKSKGPSPEELRKQAAIRRQNIYKAQRDRMEGFRKEGMSPAPNTNKISSASRAPVPLAGSRIDSVGPSSSEASKSSQYQSPERKGPENVIERGPGFQPPQQEETVPSADEANDLPIE